MYNLKMFGLMLACLVLFGSCKKDTGTTVTYTVEGLWQGNLGSGQETPSGFFALYLKNDGTLERRNVSNKSIARGDFSISGDVITGKYISDNDGTLITFRGVLDQDNTRITASWQLDASNKGTFIIYKN